MIKNVLQSVENVATYPIISLLLFITVFLAVLFFVWQMTPAEVEQASRLPLEDSKDFMEQSDG